MTHVPRRAGVQLDVVGAGMLFRDRCALSARCFLVANPSGAVGLAIMLLGLASSSASSG